MVESTNERLFTSDEVWFPEGESIGAAHDATVGKPINLDHDTGESGVAYVIKTVTGADGRISVEYTSPEVTL